MNKIRLDIGGPKGNAWYIMGTVGNLVRDKQDAKEITALMRGDVAQKLGGKGNDYEGLLRVYLREFPFVELYSSVELTGVSDELYTLDENPEIHEL